MLWLMSAVLCTAYAHVAHAVTKLEIQLVILAALCRCFVLMLIFFLCVGSPVDFCSLFSPGYLRKGLQGL